MSVRGLDSEINVHKLHRENLQRKSAKEGCVIFHLNIALSVEPHAIG